MFKLLKNKNKSKPNPKSESKQSTNKEVTQTVVIRKSGENRSKSQTFETLVVSEVPVELFEHRITHWENDVIVSDVRKLLAQPLDGPIQQKIVTTEKLTIPDQSLVVPILVNKQIGNKRQDSATVGVPIKIEQMDVPVIETVEVIDVPIKTIKRTTKKVDSKTNEKSELKDKPSL